MLHDLPRCMEGGGLQLFCHIFFTFPAPQRWPGDCTTLHLKRVGGGGIQDDFADPKIDPQLVFSRTVIKSQILRWPRKLLISGFFEQDPA